MSCLGLSTQQSLTLNTLIRYEYELTIAAQCKKTLLFPRLREALIHVYKQKRFMAS